MRDVLFAKTPSLRVGYEQSGDERGEVLVLLHGFPYDVRQFDGVRREIADLPLRVIVPYLRGYGPTAYASDEVFRSGQQAALGKDVVDLLDALGVERARLMGYDWGGRAACVAAALWPERVQGLVSVGGYTVQDIAKSARTPADAEQEHQFWYQWYFQMERGRLGLERNRREICRKLWGMWSPGWEFSEREFLETAASFDNPDFVATVVQSYRHRYANAAGDPALEELERRLAEHPTIAAPTIALHGAEDRVEPPSSSEGKEGQFTGRYERRLVSGAGHCVPAEAPGAVARAIRELVAMG